MSMLLAFYNAVQCYITIQLSRVLSGMVATFPKLNLVLTLYKCNFHLIPFIITNICLPAGAELPNILESMMKFTNPETPPSLNVLFFVME